MSSNIDTMNKFSLHEKNINSIIQSTEYLDEDFIIFLPETIFNDRLKSILTKQSISTLYKNRFEHTEAGFKNNDIGITLNDDVYDDPSITAEDLQYPSYYKKFEKKYHMLYSDLKKIVSSITTTQTINYKDLGDLVYEKVYPLVQENPTVFLAIGEFYRTENSNFCGLINYLLQNLLFSAALLEVDKNRTFTTLENRIQVCLTCCLTNIGMISIIEKTQNNEIIQLLYHKKFDDVMPKLSYKILTTSLFPNRISQGVLDSRTHYFHTIDTTSNLKYNRIKISNFGKFSFIINFYIYSLSIRQKQFSIPTVTLQVIGEQSSKQFDPLYVRMLLKNIGKLAPGTYVELKNNETGMILTTKSHSNEFPLLQILKNTNGQEVRRVNLIRLNTEERVVKRLLNVEEITEARVHRKKLLETL